jgi:hypothetical protein
VKRVACVAALVFLAGCAGKIDYVPPTAAPTSNSKEMSRPRSAVWDELVPALSKNFFVVNTIDKSSGLINISYGGDPEKYVDCGQVHSYVKNARAERNYDFNGAVAHVNYEVLQNAGLFGVDRSVDLDGRMNIVIEEPSPGHTVMTVNARYVLTVKATINDMQGHSSNLSEPLSFNTGGAGHGRTITCRPNGEFEREILALVH